MNFGMIGAGAVGTALAACLTGAGYECVGVHTRTGTSYQRFRQYVHAPGLSVRELVPRVDLLFVTTQDDNIQTVAEELWREGLFRAGQTWLHCSGALPAAVLGPQGAPVHRLSIHPLQSFAGVEAALQLLRGSHFAVEGDNPELGEKIVGDLGGIAHRLKSEDKVLYHAGAVMASNYLVALASQAVELFNLAGINSREALSALLPLMAGTLRNLEVSGLPAALTGPLARGDIEVVSRHLSRMPGPIAEVYKVLGMRALETAQEKWRAAGTVYPAETERGLKVLLNG
ncbi:Rossmann-like domain protein [Peptococcaceae bacterium CEB3]|nr:Rossmann-like domain protein [Peptococcaceae bacterium CEB3]